MKLSSLITGMAGMAVTFIDGVVSGQDLPSLSNGLCDYDTIYDSIRTGKVVEVNLRVRYHNCPANRDNKPCAAASGQGFSAGPVLNGVQTDNAIVVNDMMPGPEIRAQLGDTIRVNVMNLLGEDTTMHFHGITQFRTPFMDGGDLVNCPIAAGYSHTYEFIAHPAGTTFYHSHEGSQRLAGMTGPLIIEDPEEPYAGTPDKVLFIQDWANQNANSNFQFWGQNLAPNCVTFGNNDYTGSLNPRTGNDIGAVVGDGNSFQSFIINGKGTYEYGETQLSYFEEMQCPGQYVTPPRCEICLNQDDWTGELCKESSGDRTCGESAVIEVEVGVETRLRFPHAGGLFASQVCIDGHGVDIVAADGSPVEPHSTDCFIIFPAERYDAIIKPETAGDYFIRFTTTEGGNSGGLTEGFPHHGYAILRVVDPDSTDGPQYLADTSPIACDDNTSVNCGTDYWLTAKTMGCAAGPSRMNPERCVTAFDALQPASSPSSDASLCGDKKMPHEVDANVKATAKMSFFADEVPRWEPTSLNSRMEILMEEEFGFPYITPDDPADWGPHGPISFVSPDRPTLSLSPEQRAEVYAKRTVFREPDETNEGENFPNYPLEFNKGILGPNGMSVNYGDVVRILINCAEPYGPGCAMPHPMHLHGNKMAILYSGEWNSTYDESKFNPNPLYRDTVTVNTDQYTVVQVAATNPGVWRFHCHVTIHHRSGMAMLLDVGGDSSVEAVRSTPDESNLCPTSDDDNEESNESPGANPAEDSSPSGATLVGSKLACYFLITFLFVDYIFV